MKIFLSMFISVVFVMVLSVMCVDSHKVNNDIHGRFLSISQSRVADYEDAGYGDADEDGDGDGDGIWKENDQWYVDLGHTHADEIEDRNDGGSEGGSDGGIGDGTVTPPGPKTEPEPKKTVNILKNEEDGDPGQSSVTPKAIESPVQPTVKPVTPINPGQSSVTPKAIESPVQPTVKPVTPINPGQPTERQTHVPNTVDNSLGNQVESTTEITPDDTQRPTNDIDTTSDVTDEIAIKQDEVVVEAPIVYELSIHNVAYKDKAKPKYLRVNFRNSSDRSVRLNENWRFVMLDPTDDGEVIKLYRTFASKNTHYGAVLSFNRNPNKEFERTVAILGNRTAIENFDYTAEKRVKFGLEFKFNNSKVGGYQDHYIFTLDRRDNKLSDWVEIARFPMPEEDIAASPSKIRTMTTTWGSLKSNK